MKILRIILWPIIVFACFSVGVLFSSNFLSEELFIPVVFASIYIGIHIGGEIALGPSSKRKFSYYNEENMKPGETKNNITYMGGGSYLVGERKPINLESLRKKRKKKNKVEE